MEWNGENGWERELPTFPAFTTQEGKNPVHKKGEKSIGCRLPVVVVDIFLFFSLSLFSGLSL